MSAARRAIPAAAGGYSDAVAVELPGARWVFVAGQTPRPDESGNVPADLARQSELCFDQIEQLLASHGATLADLVQITVYLLDLTDYTDFAAVRARRVGDEPPVSAAVGVASLLGDALVEIAAVAVVCAGPA